MANLLADSSARAKGFTLIELMVVIVISAVLVTLVAPSMRALLLKNRLRGAAEEAQSMLQFARSEAVKSNTNVTVSFNDTSWCFGTAVTADPAITPNCNCTNTTSCVISIAGTDVLKRVVNSDYTGVTLTNPTAGTVLDVEFDRRRGLPVALSNRTLTFKNSGYEIRVIISALGRVRMCSPKGPTTKVWGYKDC